MFRKILLSIASILAVACLLVAFNYFNFVGPFKANLANQSQVIDTDKGPIEYIRRGNTGPLVLFLHGTPGGYDQAPAEAEYRMIAPSRPGYLRTPISVGRTPAEQADAYAALLDALEVTEKVFVMGASGGGPSSYTFTARYPERTAALIALEALSHPWTIDDDELPPAFFNTDFGNWLFLKIGEIQGPEGLVQMLIPDPANQQRVLEDEEKLASLIGLIWTTWPPSLRQDGLDNDFEQFAAMELPLADIAVPVLAVHGTADTNVDIEQAEYAAERINDFTLHVIEGADHMMPMTHAEEMGDAIQQFMVARMAESDQ